MDFLSHLLWTAALYKYVNKNHKASFRLWQAAFWGVFPDLVLVPGFVWMLWQLLAGASFHNAWSMHVEPVTPSFYFFLEFTRLAYSFTHSLVIFVLVFGILYLWKGRYFWLLGGWLFHIVLDVPTHTYKFYPTPVLWPISSFRFSGIAWHEPWFLIVNYAALILTYVWLFRRNNC